MACYHPQMLGSILYYHNVQYQVDPTHKIPENDQNLFFWLSGSFKNAILCFLNDPSWPGNVAENWNAFSTITICNIKSIQQTKLQNMAKNLFFGSLDHSNMHFSHLWMILHDLVMLPNVRKHLALSQYAIKSIQQTKLQKMVKNLFFWLFGSFKTAFFWFLNDPAWPGDVAEHWKTFSTITICDI